MAGSRVEYRYGDIVNAIRTWNGNQTIAIGNARYNDIAHLHVPGGGRIQDKRPKGRTEVQANFISDWGPNGARVNVHVNLHRDDWHLVPRN